MIIIEKKWGKITVDYIKGYNANKKYAKAIWKTINQYTWENAYNLIIYKVIK